MTYWLIDSSGSGSGERDAGFWIPHLRDAGITSVRVEAIEDQDKWTADIESDDVLIAAGGDGSVSCVAGICLRKNAILAVLPSGTANDFARNLGIPEDPSPAVELIAENHVLDIDVASAGERIYLNVAHIGLGTLPSRQAGKTAKRLFGRFSYAVTLFRRLFAQRGFKARIETENGVLEDTWVTVAIATGAYFGGGYEVPEASIDDGKLDVLAVRPRSIFELLFTLATFRLKKHRDPKSDAVCQVKGTWCEIRTSKPKTITMDGDVAGKTPIRIECKAGALRVVGREITSTN